MPQLVRCRDSQAPGEVRIIRRNQRVDVDVQRNPELEPGRDGIEIGGAITLGEQHGPETPGRRFRTGGGAGASRTMTSALFESLVILASHSA